MLFWTSGSVLGVIGLLGLMGLPGLPGTTDEKRLRCLALPWGGDVAVVVCAGDFPAGNWELVLMLIWGDVDGDEDLDRGEFDIAFSSVAAASPEPSKTTSFPFVV